MASVDFIIRLKYICSSRQILYSCFWSKLALFTLNVADRWSRKKKEIFSLLLFTFCGQRGLVCFPERCGIPLSVTLFTEGAPLKAGLPRVRKPTTLSFNRKWRACTTTNFTRVTCNVMWTMKIDSDSAYCSFTEVTFWIEVGFRRIFAEDKSRDVVRWRHSDTEVTV